MNSEELNSLISYVKNYPPSDDPIAKFMQELSKPNFEHERKIALFESYLQTLEGYLEQEAQQAKDKIHKSRAKIDKEFKELDQKVKAGRISSEPEVVGRHQEEILARWGDGLQYDNYWSDTVDEFADTLRKSFFMNLYGFWESQLFPLCKALKSYDYTMPSPKAVKDNIKNAVGFLEKIGYPIGDGKSWDTIYDNYRPLRNCLAHYNGELSRCSSKEKIESFIRTKKPALSIRGQIIVINKGFCEESLETITQFFKDLLDALTQWALPQTTS
jgi:ElaB/YqjD/DUF883 family membrane-anchored ribosome-binding protein